MNLSRISRLLELLSLLQAGRQNADSLAQACGVSRRTVFRDLQTLRETGLPLEYDDQRRTYSLHRAVYLPPTNFTAEEALALVVLCHELGDDRRLPFYGPARRAAARLQASLPARLQEQLRDVAGTIEIRLAPANPLAEHVGYYQQLVDAAAARRAVRITYGSLTEWRDIQTKLCPYRMLFSRRSWYVIGRSSLHRQTRTFNVGRIRSLEALDETFRVPRNFSIDRYLGNAWHLIPSGRDCAVRIRFAKLVAQNVAEVLWHKTQQLVWNADGTLDYCVTVAGLEEISWWILGYGDQAEVLAPQELRQIVAERARKLLTRYDIDVD